MNMKRKPELLAPAGDLEKLKAAIVYGADAVYVGGQSYGLRANAKNFNIDELADGISFAHNHGARVYVTANIFARNDDYKKMAEYFSDIRKAGADALIISDPGVFTLARETVPDMEIHISTQANITSYRSVNFWKSLGASRVILARELSFDEIKKISAELTREFEPGTGNKLNCKDKRIELEAFIHGAMCVSYSGRCLLSAFMSGRDSNRGDCSQPCRWPYALSEKKDGGYYPVSEDERGTYILNSKDLCMIRHIPELIGAGLDSLKIEGRMKSVYYVATTVKAYREAIDDFFESPDKYEAKKDFYMAEVQKNSHREFDTGFYFGRNDGLQIYETGSYIREYDFVGIVLAYDPAKKMAVVEQRNKFVTGEKIEFFQSGGGGFSQVISEMYDEDGLPVCEAPHPKQVLSVRVDKAVKEFDLLRKKVKVENDNCKKY